MPNKSYLFYDLETTGLDVSFDQVVQFAAILTDENLNELKRFNYLIRLNPDTIPSAFAQITHQISINQANSQGINEYDAMNKIHQLLNRANTINLGYNTLGFDDEFLRFSFYRNLLDPYTHQYKDGCRRMDIYPMTIMYYLHDQNRLKWPKNSQGHISFKLEHLNTANELVKGGRAHDALTDVEVTVALARILKQNQAMWHYLENLFIKQNDQQQLDKIDKTISINDNLYTQGLLTNGKFGARNQYQSLGLLLGQHNHYKNQNCWLRLDLDHFPEAVNQFLLKQNHNEDSQQIIIDEFHDKLALPYVNKKLGETPFLLPLLDRFTNKLTSKKIENCEKNIQWLQENTSIFQQIKDHLLNYQYPTFEQTDSQSALYLDGFLKPFEKNQCELFHQKNIRDKAKMLNKFQGHLKARALRIIGRIQPELLTSDELELFQKYLESITEYDASHRPFNFKGNPARGLDDVYNEINTLKSETNLDSNQIQLLDELSAYLNI
ncbi:exodeoxyribonuclease I [Thiotrichales bacterium 19S3-7]|nr:exodeoxyribonuclease I [Thiotrichales bacterium 19S3-7]MCF6802480.1 exodeoxyribonuclease I [Thiotrichales bacterium 19S3-11]